MFLSDMLDMVNRKRRIEERRQTALKFAIGMGIAAAIGLAKGVLYAPKPGKETREALKEKALQAVETVKKRVKGKAEAIKIKDRQGKQAPDSRTT